MSPGSVEIFSEGIEFNYPNPEGLREWIHKAFVSEKKQYSYLNIIFCTDDNLLALNQDYLDHDYYTDIISFQYQKKPIEGELYISMDRVRDNASKFDISWMTELHRVIIHGVLHLIGYGDKSDEDKTIMRAKENQYLSMLDHKIS